MDIRFAFFTVLLALSAPANAFVDLAIKDSAELFPGTTSPIYLLRGGEAAPDVFAHARPLEAGTDSVAFRWRSELPNVHYSIKINSGSLPETGTPSADVPLEGTLPQHEKEFSVYLHCGAEHASGVADFTIQFEFEDTYSGAKFSHEVELNKKCSEEKPKAAFVASYIGKNSGGGTPSHRYPSPFTHRVSHKPPKHLSPPRSSAIDKKESKSGITSHFRNPQTLILKKKPSSMCKMCQVPTSVEEFRRIICNAHYVVRARLAKHSSSSRTSSRSWMVLNLNDIRKFEGNWPLLSRQQTKAKKSPRAAFWFHRAKIVLGRDGSTCTCNGTINNQAMYLLAGKINKSGRQIVVKHNRGMLLPWRQARQLFRSARRMTCP